MSLSEFLRSELKPTVTYGENGLLSVEGYTEESGVLLEDDVTVNCLVLCPGLKTNNAERVHRVDQWQEVLSSFRDHLHGCGITEARKAQSFLWPYILRGKDALCIGQPRSGKTTSCLIPLISAALTTRSAPRNVTQVLPFSLIICPTVETVEKVTNLARILVPGNAVKIVPVERESKLSLRKPDVKSELRNGADIVITTPEPFLKMMEMSILSLALCSRIVFEEADKLLVLHMSSVKQIYLKYVEACKNKLESVPDLKTNLTSNVVLRMCKTIVVAEKFTDEVADFQAASQHNPILVITDYFEAAIRAKVEFEAHFAATKEQRKNALVESLNRVFQYLDRVVICCIDEEEATEIADKLSKVKELGRRVVVLNCSTNQYDVNQTISKWNSDYPPILVISDDVLLPTALISNAYRNADCIIHYSIPAGIHTKKQFSQRFELMSRRLEKNEQVNVLKSILLLGTENANQAHELVELYSRLKLPVPDALNDLRKASPRGLCRRWASFGVCKFQKYFCYKDHFLVPNLPPDRLPSKGQVKFFIGNVVTANELFVRIIETRDEDSKGVWKPYPNQLSDFCDELNMLRHTKHQPVTNVQVNDVYGILFKDEVRRVRIVDQTFVKAEFYESIRRNYVEVEHMDYGSHTKVEVRQLVPLPSHLKEIPPLAVKVYIVGIKPPENLVNWDPVACEFLKQMFEKEEFHHMTGWIYISASGCLWLDDVKIHHRLKSISGGIETMGQTFTSALVQDGHAVRTAKPDFPNHNSDAMHLKTKFRVQELQNISQKAFLPADQMVDVYLTHFKSLKEFYVRRVDFDKCLVRLENEMQQHDHFVQVTHPQVGLICMQQYIDGTINRVSILRLKGGGCADVFYLDHGEDFEVDLNTLFQIPTKFLTQLPFQAIKCQLEGLEEDSPIDPEVVYDMTRTDDNKFKVLLGNRVSDPVDGLYTITLHSLHHETNEDWFYQSFSQLLGISMDVDPEPFLRITKPVRAPDDDDEVDPAEANFISDINEMANEKICEISDSLPIRRLGHVARRRNEAGDGEESDGEYEPGDSFQPPDKVEIHPDDFNYEVDKNLPPKPFPDDDDDVESDDELDLDEQPDDFLPDIPVDRNGEVIIERDETDDTPREE